MKDQNQTEMQLINELAELRKRIAELKTLENERKQTEEALRQSEEKYRTILEEMEEGYFETDLVGNLTFINDAGCRHLGYPRQELIGMNNRVYADEENAKKVFQAFNKAYKTGEPCRVFDYEITRKDGTKAIIEMSASLMRNSEGEPIGFRGVSRDITERKRAEEEYRTILRTTMDGFWITDIQGRFLDVNDAYCQLIGYSWDELLTMSISDVEALERPEETAQHIQRIMETGGARFETHHQCKDGRMIDLEVSVNYTKIGNERLFVFLRDITERKRAEEALKGSEQRLESELRKFKVLYDLAVNISADKSLNENLAFIVEQSRNLLHADTSYIALADEQCQEVYMHTVSGIRTEAFKKMRLPFGRGLGGKVMTTRKGYIIEDYHQDGTITHIVDQVVIDEGLVSGMAVPIQIGEKSLGVLYVFNHTKTQFKQEDMNTLSLLGNLAAVEIAIHEAQQALRKSERISKRFAQENAAIAEIGRIISSTLNIEEVYDRFAEEVKELIPFDRIAIRTINPKDNTTTTAYILGVDVPGRQLGSTVPLFGTVIERCIRTQSSLLFQPESMDEVVNRFPHLLPTFKAGLRSMIFVPLISKDQVIGVLSLQATEPKAHTEGDLRLAGRVGHQITGAIVNAQLFADLKQTEEAKEKLICELENALSQIKQLKGLLPICMYCKKIRNDKNYWEAVESYITVHSEAIFSHGVCPECHKKYIEPQLKQLESEEK